MTHTPVLSSSLGFLPKVCEHSFHFPEMGREAAANALKDAKIEYSEVEAVVASYNYGDPTCGKCF